ncbi:hypothetical protein BJX66DRAFT_291437 [Aspergillus keveii]|uniref:Uncharacterized protein n=1 Tax=Aspergillus keveii TaxID=714993 RepID=A0ABR4GMM9_9EURO
MNEMLSIGIGRTAQVIQRSQLLRSVKRLTRKSSIIFISSRSRRRSSLSILRRHCCLAQPSFAMTTLRQFPGRQCRLSRNLFRPSRTLGCASLTFCRPRARRRCHLAQRRPDILVLYRRLARCSRPHGLARLVPHGLSGEGSGSANPRNPYSQTKLCSEAREEKRQKLR